MITSILAGPLLAAGAAKLFRPPLAAAWPYKRGLLAWPAGPRIVAALELAVAAAIVVLPGRAAAAVGVLAYAALTVVAWRLRGRKCACFGIARLANVGRTHVLANAGLAAAAAVVLVLDPARSGWMWRIPAAAVGAAITWALVWFLDRRRETAQVLRAADCDQPVHGVRLYVSDTCPACLALEQLVTEMEPLRRSQVQIERNAEQIPGDGVPCAVALSWVGEPVCEPVTGVTAVRTLITRITIGQAHA